MPLDPASAVCVLCRGPVRIAFAIGGHNIVDCERCGHRQATLAGRLVAGGDPAEHVADVYGDGYFTGGGAGYVDYLAEGALLRRRGAKYGALLARHAPAGSVLDVGAAAGFVLQGLADAGWAGRGIEPNAAMAAHARDALGLDVATGPFEALAPAPPVDAVTMVQVVAHFADPGAALRRAAEATRPGGLLLVETWDRGSRTARLLGRRWHEYSPPSVLHWFTRDGLERLAGDCGYEPVDHGRMVKWIAGSHARSLLRHRRAPGSVGYRLAGLVPSGVRLPYPSEDLFWALYRRR